MTKTTEVLPNFLSSIDTRKSSAHVIEQQIERAHRSKQFLYDSSHGKTCKKMIINYTKFQQTNKVFVDQINVH